MLPYERQEKILALIKEKRYVPVKTLCDILYFSEATIRRDLEKIEQLGMISRIRGGAALNDSPNVEMPLSIRQTENKRAKMLIAQKASELIMDGDTLILDASSSVLQMIPFLSSKKGLTIITNGLLTASSITANCTNYKLYCTGGILRENCTSSLVGSQARQFITNINATKMFFSIRSLSMKHGLTDLTEEEAELKKTMMQHAGKIILLADSSKIDCVSLYRVCYIDNINMVISNDAEIWNSNTYSTIKDKLVLVPNK